MHDKIDVALTNTLAMIRTNCKSDDALKYAQAAWYLAQVKTMTKGTGQTKGAGS
jgi:hypothetical protein